MSFPEGLKNIPFNTTPPYYHCPSLSSEPQRHKRNNNTHKTALVWVWNSWRLWSHGQSKKEWNLRFLLFSLVTTHCKCFDHKNYRDWKLQGTCRENLHYLWKRAVRIAGNPCDNYRTNNYHRDSLQFLQPFSIDSADFPCRSPAISSPCSFYGQNICSVVQVVIVAQYVYNHYIGACSL